MEPIVLAGRTAFSPFRQEVLLKHLQDTGSAPVVHTLEARFVYFLDCASDQSSDQMNALYDLLDVPEGFDATLSANLEGRGFFVTPRHGTISPWSSKATEIMQHAGFHFIRRVERGIWYQLFDGQKQLILETSLSSEAKKVLYDRMTEDVTSDVRDLFALHEPSPLTRIPVCEEGLGALERWNTDMGLALSSEEMEYLFKAYRDLKRDPTDVELVMFAQVNSEHCRHKIFNADWIVDGLPGERSLFKMIRNTHAVTPQGTLVAYADNSSVMEGFPDAWFSVNAKSGYQYQYVPTQMDILMKVETHNHPTAISPYPGAATGVGGEIRDEAATGIGSKTKAGLCGFMVSNLRIPGWLRPWEKEYASFPDRLATPLMIMKEGPIGGASFGNEFGRPQLCGIFKTYEEEALGQYRGYHKPIMLAGGMGNIRREHCGKKEIPKGARVMQIGGPAMRIGIGGGAASSMATGSNALELDYASVQRGNAEMQRRCQEVIDACTARGTENPILSIHDIGAGGLSNACPELLAETGGKFFLRAINNEEPSMSPMEIWCCEAQERYVLAIAPDFEDAFYSLCKRERCPVACVGEATGDGHLLMIDDHFDNHPVDLPMEVLLGSPPKMIREITHVEEKHAALDFSPYSIDESAQRVLQLPAVANKTFLITITDRSITGLVARDQMVGPYQTPIADAAVTATSFQATTGEAMTMGERTNLAVVNAPASGRMAVAEAVTNIAGTAIGAMDKIKLSANWMCACGESGEDTKLYDTVHAVAMEFCPAIGLSIPVGKDSLSMRTVWQDEEGASVKQTAPLSLVVSAFAPVEDIQKTVTADLKPVDSILLLLDLGQGKNRMGAGALAQVTNQIGDTCPDMENPQKLKDFFLAIQELVHAEKLLAYHDRSDGGLFTTLTEMALGGRRGWTIQLDSLAEDDLAVLFNEEAGAVLQIRYEERNEVLACLQKHGLNRQLHVLGITHTEHTVRIRRGEDELFVSELTMLNRHWSELTYRMQALRDHPACAQEEYDNCLNNEDPGLKFHCAYDPDTPFHVGGAKPAMAIFREQGVNGQVEMAAAFDRAGFNCQDVHMTDLLSGRVELKNFQGLVACGGFSYGDVLGAGSGWAKTILYHEILREMFVTFFKREDTFTLGVCNGCQMVAQLKSLIPGAADWPQFKRNRSEQFEARFVTVEIFPSPSILFKGMEGARLGIPVAHGEGRADFTETGSYNQILENGLDPLHYVDNYGQMTETYPYNPNGSQQGLTAVTTTDGRVTIMMPHPERVFLNRQFSYRPTDWQGENSPWLRMFQNARTFVG